MLVKRLILCRPFTRGHFFYRLAKELQEPRALFFLLFFLFNLMRLCRLMSLYQVHILHLWLTIIIFFQVHLNFEIAVKPTALVLLFTTLVALLTERSLWNGVSFVDLGQVRSLQLLKDGLVDDIEHLCLLVRLHKLFLRLAESATIRAVLQEFGEFLGRHRVRLL